MLRKKFFRVMVLFFTFAVIAACSSNQQDIQPAAQVSNDSHTAVITKNEQSTNDIVTLADAEKELATEILKTIESYLNKQTPPEFDTKLAETLESTIGLISDTNRRANFMAIATHIRNGEKEEVVPKFAALMEDYELGTVTVNNVDVNESNESSSPSSNIISSLDSNEVKTAIEDYAKEEWADDYKMQAYEIEEQTKAYKELIELSIDDDVLKGILDYSYEEWGHDFRMVRYEFQEQLDALIQIKKLETSDDVKKKILDNSFSEWGTDYRMVLYEYNNQLEAHESLK